MKPKIHNLSAHQLLIISSTRTCKPRKEPILLPTNFRQHKRRDYRALGGAAFLAALMSLAYVVVRVLEEAIR